MSHWQEEVQHKQITARQAAALIHSGDRIMIGNRDCRAVLREIVARQDLEDVRYYAPIINFIPEGETDGRPGLSSSHKLFE